MFLDSVLQCLFVRCHLHGLETDQSGPIRPLSTCSREYVLSCCDEAAKRREALRGQVGWQQGCAWHGTLVKVQTLSGQHIVC